jgi:pimeloyl-ACP methyl ester carboxylesterase
VTVPQLGTTSDSVNLGINPIDVETQVRDLEFALGEMDRFPGVDNTKLAVAGHSMGGIAALILQFRNANVDAVIGLDASYSNRSLARLLTQSPYYQPEKMQVPFLDLRRPSDEVDLSSVNIFRYADKYFLGFPEIYHGDFTSFPMIALRFPTDIQNRTPETASRGYELVCRYALNFLNAYLKQNAASFKFISDRPEANGIPTSIVRYEFRKGLQAPPTEQEFVQSIERDGLQKAIDLYREFKMREPQQPIVNERVLNTLGYALLGSGQLSQAINVFRLNVEAHPTSANAYDSLADAYVRNGNKIEAIKQYEKVLEVLTNDKNASEEEKKSLRKTALEGLKRLRQ